MRVELAERLARMALAAIQREYPNKIAHALESEADVAAPRRLTPAFYGAYDWHSAVHGHWALARLARRFPEAAFAAEAAAVLRAHLTEENLKQEAAYLSAPGRASFERPYGLAWLLLLAAETDVSLEPLEKAVVRRVSEWLPRLSRPVRSGEHSNTAFALGLMIDYARARGRREFEALVESRARVFYYADRDAPVGWEPSGEDFLSPCLAEADLMRRILPYDEFAAWFDAFAPDLTALRPVAVAEASDGKLAHFAGLNLSRAWMLARIAGELPEGSARVAALGALAQEHAREGLRFLTSPHYEITHWLGTFAVYLLCP